jgi:hypothetical protein
MVIIDSAAASPVGMMDRARNGLMTMRLYGHSSALSATGAGRGNPVWNATAPELAGRGGMYLEGCRVPSPWATDAVPPNGYYLPYALDPERAGRLWDLSRAGHALTSPG